MSELSAAPLPKQSDSVHIFLCLFFLKKENIGKVLSLKNEAFSQIIAVSKSTLKS